MSRLRHRDSVLCGTLLAACVVVLLGHLATGHTHADALSPIPVEGHAPGDGHHEVSDGSCEALKASPGAAPLAGVGEASLVPAVLAMSGVVLTGPPVTIPQRPRFLLHAALLI